MKSGIFSRRTAHSRNVRSELLLTNLAFLLGVVTFLFSKSTLSFFENELPRVAGIDFRIFGCVFILIVVQLSAFSIVGSAIIPIADWMMGMFVPMSLATIIPNDELSAVIILKLFCCLVFLIFICISVSGSSLVSAKILFNKVRNEKRIKVDLVKSLLLALLLVILSIIGISDINTFL